MRPWNTADHHISDTDHATLDLADSGEIVIADWEVTSEAPDRDGRIYKTLCGWISDGSGRGHFDSSYPLPIGSGRAHLLHAALRGHQPISDQPVHIKIRPFGKPVPNTWDHPGYMLTARWMDRRVDGQGRPIHDDKLGVRTWTNPSTGEVLDLGAAYFTGDGRDPQHYVWRYYDHWVGDTPLMEVFPADAQAPNGLETRLASDSTWHAVPDTTRSQNPA
ncbi:hypothetical protein [Streptomyces xiamenensis]|uniref:hypothetical protein n=1 Tax=Streptomyces xiamenensis TaxID=408015 RepID=UPI0035D732F7